MPSKTLRCQEQRLGTRLEKFNYSGRRHRVIKYSVFFFFFFFFFLTESKVQEHLRKEFRFGLLWALSCVMRYTPVEQHSYADFKTSLDILNSSSLRMFILEFLPSKYGTELLRRNCSTWCFSQCSSIAIPWWNFGCFHQRVNCGDPRRFQWKLFVPLTWHLKILLDSKTRFSSLILYLKNRKQSKNMEAGLDGLTWAGADAFFRIHSRSQPVRPRSRQIAGHII